MNKAQNYELELLYTPTETSDNQITELGKKFKVSVSNTVLPRDVDHPKDRKYIEESMERQKEKSGFPYGIATFKPMEYKGLCELVQASMDVIDIRTMAFRGLK